MRTLAELTRGPKPRRYSARIGFILYAVGVLLLALSLIPSIATRTFTWWMIILFVLAIASGGVGGVILQARLIGWIRRKIGWSD
jgi:hypothetical protein